MSATIIRPNRRSDMMGVAGARTLFPAFLRERDVSITHLVCRHPNHGMTATYDLEDSFLLTLQLNAFHFGLTCRGRRGPDSAFPAGVACIYEMDRMWRADMVTPFEVMHFHVTRAALDALAEDLDLPSISGIRCPPNEAVGDSVLYGLGLALAPAFDRAGEASRLFVDHVRLALGLHVVQRYGILSAPFDFPKGGLAPWQLRRALEFINANLDGAISIAAVAGECGLSAGHFARAFRASTGLPPHSWMLARRIERAKAMLLNGEHSIAHIATRCGFADQSHLTRTFLQIVGHTPAAWRRARQH